MAGYDPFVELLGGEPIYSTDGLAVTDEGVFPGPVVEAAADEEQSIDPFMWLFVDEDGTQLVAQGGIFYGPGFIWPSQEAVVAPPPSGIDELSGASSSVLSVAGTLTQLHTVDVIVSVVAEASGTVTVKAAALLVGAVSAVADTTGTLSQVHTLDAAAEGVVEASGSITETLTLGAASVGVAETSATLRIFSNLTVTVSAAAETTGVVSSEIDLELSIFGDSSFSAEIGTIKELAATINGDSSFLAGLNGEEVRITAIHVEAFEPSIEEVRVTAIQVEAFELEVDPMVLNTDGDATFAPDLQVEPFHADWFGDATFTAKLDPYIFSVGEATVFLGLDNGFTELGATMTGDATFSSEIGILQDHPYEPLNYPFECGDDNIIELGFSPDGFANFTVDLSGATAPSGGSAQLFINVNGDATTTFGPMDNPDKFATIINGDSLFLAELFVDGTAELSMTSTGDAFMFNIGSIIGGLDPIDKIRGYYVYGNVIVGFDPTEAGGADGNIIDFNRYMGLYLDVGVGFDYTDDVSARSGFVSQSYPDGDIIRDFARYKWQYVNITTEEPPPDCRLTVGPAPRSPKDLASASASRPPRRRNR